MSKDKKLSEIWQDVKNSSKTQNEFKRKFVHELTQKSNDITIDEYIDNFKMATDEKYKYNHSFFKYFSSYANFVVFQLDSIEERANPVFLIPLVYLVHHTVELFVKFIKLEATDLLQKKDTVIDLLAPINTSDIDLNVHKIIDVLDEDVCVSWFNYLPIGDDIRQGIIRKYKHLCKIMKTDNLAEDTRFPTKRISYGCGKLIKELYTIHADEISQINTPVMIAFEEYINSRKQAIEQSRFSIIFPKNRF